MSHIFEVSDESYQALATIAPRMVRRPKNSSRRGWMNCATKRTVNLRRQRRTRQASMTRRRIHSPRS